MNRSEALELLHEYTQSESLRRHGYAVAAALRAYAGRFGEDELKWEVTGLLHDFDYERWPEPPDHTQKGAEILRARGVGEEIVLAILSHAEWNQIPRDTPLRKTLFAIDELSGFIMAVAYVRPTRRLEEVDVRAVRRKMKDKAFARAVRREDITEGAESLGLDLDEHITFTLAALQAVHEELGL